jgi:sugar lactone lactonase YvrE
MLLAVALACTEPPPSGTGPDDEGTTWTTGHTGGVTSPPETAHTGVAGHTGHTGAPTGCDALPPHPLDQGAFDIATTEDFDFDAEGNLVYVDNYGNLMGADGYGSTRVVSPGNGWETDARGVQVLSTGEIAINYIGGNRIVKVDPATGARTDLLTGVQGPNALEVGVGDVLYFTEAYANPGRVGVYDPVTDRAEVIATGFTYPNGLALSPDQRTLYVSDDSRGIYKLEKDPVTDEWGEKVRLFDPAVGEAYDAMEVDVCGNLYSAQFYSGKLYRYDPVTDTAALVVDLNDPGGFLWNAIRWGSNRGRWERDTLYVTSRHRVFALALGVEGPPQPVDLAP